MGSSMKTPNLKSSASTTSLLSKTGQFVTIVLGILFFSGLAWLYTENYCGSPIKVQDATAMLIDSLKDDLIVSAKLIELPSEVLFDKANGAL